MHSAPGAAADEICDGTFFWRVRVEGRESRECIFGSACKKHVTCTDEFYWCSRMFGYTGRLELLLMLFISEL